MSASAKKWTNSDLRQQWVKRKQQPKKQFNNRFHPRFQARGVLSVSRFQISPTTPERKYLDNSVSLGVDTTGGIVLMNGLIQGLNQFMRIGNRICIVKIQVRMEVICPSTGAAQTGRFLVVYDKQADGASPAITDILTGSSAMAFMNLQNSDRFVVYINEVVDINVQGSTGTQTPFCKSFDRNVDVSLPTVYSGTGSTITSISSGSLYFLSIGMNAAGALGGTVSGNARIRYTDV